ncbi:MAG: hypothetical protein K0Q87_1701 [Neobacillus sp.]|jgi:hypothetical protein|nr:hypothetical protein [Neobacillus sp.]
MAMNDSVKSRLKKLEKRSIPEEPKLEDLLLDPDYFQRHPRTPELIEKHRREFAAAIGFDYE